jgi:hypothetical protein
MLKQQQQLAICITLSPSTIAAVRHQIHGCEECSAEANLPLAHLFVRLTGCGESMDYAISEEINCPRCVNPLDTNTLVETRRGAANAAVMGRC